jgi:hypothetical protein
MSTKAQVKMQAKTPPAPVVARIPQPPVTLPEHEAERPDIAAQLEGAARLGHSLGAVGVNSSAPPIIQRQEIPEEEEEELQLKREPAAVQRQELPEEEEEELMMKPEEGRVGPQGGPVPPEVEAAIGRARGGGQPLEGVLQAQMSASLGHDFSRVRVHTGPEADELNQQLQAKAFTTGGDIFFKRGEYRPTSSEGQQLIVHELSHVVQQTTGRVSGGGGGMTVRPAEDAFEQEANEQARLGALQRHEHDKSRLLPEVLKRPELESGVVQLVRFKEGLLEDRDPPIYKKIQTIAKQMGLKRKKSSFRDVLTAVWAFAAKQPYVPGGTTPTLAILQDWWSCEALTFLLLFLKGYVEDKWTDPNTQTGGWTDASGRRFSKPGLVPNMKDIHPPNVKLDGKPMLYTFKSHMWAKIDGQVFDPITGVLGLGLLDIWPHVLVDDQLISLGLVSYELFSTSQRKNGMVEMEFIPKY